ncbi:MAG: hypothetical protein IJ533_05645 [Prevotella sp.]|nr:hypothetical protein [Prevotella sp.]
MNKLQKIRTLTEKFFNGETTPAEEQELYDFYRQDNIPEDLRPHCKFFRDLAALTTLAAVRHAVEPVAAVRGFEPSRRLWWAVAAAVVALLVVGGAALYRYQSENECVAYIYGERVTDRAVVLGEMQKTMAAMTADGSDVVEEQLKSMFGKD